MNSGRSLGVKRRRLAAMEIEKVSRSLVQQEEMEGM
jgi:hypothetical protein